LAYCLSWWHQNRASTDHVHHLQQQQQQQQQQQSVMILASSKVLAGTLTPLLMTCCV
jgi:hypothetical protein